MTLLGVGGKSAGGGLPFTYIITNAPTFGYSNGAVAAYAGGAFAAVPNPNGNLVIITRSDAVPTGSGAGLTQIQSGNLSITGANGVCVNYTATNTPAPPPTLGTPCTANGSGGTFGTASSWETFVPNGNQVSFPNYWGPVAAQYIWSGPATRATIYVQIITSDMIAAGVPPLILPLVVMSATP
jgi:hypothetical protein